jgi:hypothetical protein
MSESSIYTILKYNLKTLADKVVKALYGMNNIYVDVTHIIKSKILENDLTFVVKNEVFGSDPVPNVVKKLHITYYDKELLEDIFNEHDFCFLKTLEYFNIDDLNAMAILK